MLSVWKHLGWGFLFALLMAAFHVIAHAQTDGLFSELLQPTETSESSEAEPEVQLDYEAGVLYNDHVEFGLSIDPNTSSLAGREDPQLKGWVAQTAANLQGVVPFSDQWTLRLQYSPLLEDYSGEDGGLDVFDAFTDVFVSELEYRPTESFPALRASHQLVRLNREDDTYDNTERQLRLGFGQFLEYGLNLRRFNDAETRREDFLLVGSTSQQARAQAQLGISPSVLAKLEYSLERERYEANLNNLVLGIAGIADGDTRTDWRHFVSTRLLETFSNRFVLQEELNLLWNNSDVAFYDFASVEAALTAFYKFEAERWVRLRVSYLSVGFSGRQVRGEDLLVRPDAEDRKDDQWAAQFRINWKLWTHVNLLVDYQLTDNNTNETADIFEFLSYTNHTASIRARLRY